MSVDTVRMGHIVLGQGKPKVCVPIMGADLEQVLIEAEKICELPCDIIEWRVDWLKVEDVLEEVKLILPKLRSVMGEIPLIFTIRTKDEGGERCFSVEEYKNINTTAIRSGYVDVVDVELFVDGDAFATITQAAHEVGKYVIASNHDFFQTPSREEMVSRLKQMEAKGADILKIAVMPQDSKDVLELLEATREASEEQCKKPVVTMSMSGMGVLSRIGGEVFGSTMTFGAGDQVSAPGQIPARKLVEILEILHK